MGTDESGDPIADSDWEVVLILPFSGGDGEAVEIPVNPAWLVLLGSAGTLLLGLAALRRRRRLRG